MTIRQITDSSAVRQQLRDYPFFSELSDEHLDQLLHQAHAVSLKPGETLVEEGEPGSSAFLILSGEIEIYRRAAGGSDAPIAVRSSGEVVGEMALLMDDKRTATMRARTATEVLPISREAFQSILTATPTMPAAMLRCVLNRLQHVEAQLVQHQKMAALGTLAAGLAHELNNPAAAVARSSGQLRTAIAEWERRAASPGIAALDEGDRAALNTLRDEMLTRASSANWLDPLTRSDREQAVQAWLERIAVDQAWLLAPRLVDAGWDAELLQQIEEFISDGHLADVVRWLAAGQTVFLLLEELTAGARSISAIVSAVKAYTRLDQAPVQDVDINEGLDQTLTILQHKLRGIHVRREYGVGLPVIPAYASELNQVWTNLIDNAADALNGQGEIVIRTAQEGDRIVVDICDTGPGIPEEIQHRLFEPFFTTKPPGKGTGLGLNISYNIVRKHRGDITVNSKPGETCFRVRIPVTMKGSMSQ